MFPVIFTLPHRLMISSAYQGKKKKFRGIFGSTSHTTTTAKVEVTRNDMPLEGAGTELANPRFHLDAILAKSLKALYKSDQEANRKQ